MRHFAGLDWGGSSHAVCVVDEGGKVVTQFEVTHDAAGLTELRARLAKLAPSAEFSIAIERPSGLVVDTLVAAGLVVVPIHPNVVKACRPRYRAAGGKDDRGDSYLLADVLRTDGHRFRPLAPQSDAIKALRALVRTRDDLVAERVSLANQLRSLLDSFWPGAEALFADIDSPIALAFVQRYPTPRSAASLGPKRLASFLAQHRYSGRRSASELIERLRAAPEGLARGAEANAKGELVRALARGRAARGRPHRDVVPSRGAHQRRADPRRARRRPRTLPDRGAAGRRGRRLPGHVRERQVPWRLLPLGMQQASPLRPHQLGLQLRSLLALGQRRLCSRPRTRLRSPSRRPHPGPRLGARALARVDEPHHLRARSPRRDEALPRRRLRGGLTQEVSLHVLPDRERRERRPTLQTLRARDRTDRTDRSPITSLLSAA